MCRADIYINGLILRPHSSSLNTAPIIIGDGTGSSSLTLTNGSATFIGNVVFPHAFIRQYISITNGVTVSSSSGIITTVFTTLEPVTSAIFTVTNTAVTIDSVVICTIVNYNNTCGIPVVRVDNVISGKFDIIITNAHALEALGGNLKISFIVV